MGIFTFTLPPEIAYLALLAAAVTIFRNAVSARWKDLSVRGIRTSEHTTTDVATPGTFSAWCAFCVALPLLWSFDIPAAPVLQLHLLGMPLFVLMFGRRLAMAGCSLSVIAYTVLHDGLWTNIGMNLLLLAVLPAYVGEAVLLTTRRFLPRHMFVYLLGNGFFGALLMLVTIGLVALVAHGLWIGDGFKVDTLAYMMLLAWGEAFLTGFLLTIFTVYRPEWVLTFDDEIYLRGK